MERHRSLPCAVAALLLLLSFSTLRAEGDPAGYWKGTLSVPQADVPIAVDVAKTEAGSWSGKIDIPGQGIRGHALEEVSFADGSLRFVLPGIPGGPVFEGELSDDGGTISGNMTQAGQAFPFTLTRAEAPEDGGVDVYADYTAPGTPGQGAAGTWLGLLESGPMRLRLVVTVEAAEDGSLAATMKSPDQGNVELAANDVALENGTFRYKIAQVQGAFTGSLTEDGSAIEGEWSQGPNSLPLTLKRQP